MNRDFAYCQQHECEHRWKCARYEKGFFDGDKPIKCESRKYIKPDIPLPVNNCEYFIHEKR
jgi:hypothetical protein